MDAQCERNVPVVCDQPQGLRGKFAEHTEAPIVWAGGSHHQATMMVAQWATSSRPSASESQAATSVPPGRNSRVHAGTGVFPLTGGLR